MISDTHNLLDYTVDDLKGSLAALHGTYFNFTDGQISKIADAWFSEQAKAKAWMQERQLKKTCLYHVNLPTIKIIRVSNQELHSFIKLTEGVRNGVKTYSQIFSLDTLRIAGLIKTDPALAKIDIEKSFQVVALDHIIPTLVYSKPNLNVDPLSLLTCKIRLLAPPDCKLTQKKKIEVLLDICRDIQSIHSENRAHGGLRAVQLKIDSDENLHSYAYISPERFCPRYEIKKEDDIWALGVILYEAYHNRYFLSSYNKQTELCLRRMLEHGGIYTEDFYLYWFSTVSAFLNTLPSEPYHNLIRGCLSRHPNERLSIDRVIESLEIIDTQITDD